MPQPLGEDMCKHYYGIPHFYVAMQILIEVRINLVLIGERVGYLTTRSIMSNKTIYLRNIQHWYGKTPSHLPTMLQEPLFASRFFLSCRLLRESLIFSPSTMPLEVPCSNLRKLSFMVTLEPNRHKDKYMTWKLYQYEFAHLNDKEELRCGD